MPKWLAKAKRLRNTGMSYSSIGITVGVSQQTVWAALRRDRDPQFRRRMQKQWRRYKSERRSDPERAAALREYERAESAERYKDPKYRKAQQKRMSEYMQR